MAGAASAMTGAATAHWTRDRRDRFLSVAFIVFPPATNVTLAAVLR
jgi:hypothetical protein